MKSTVLLLTLLTSACAAQALPPQRQVGLSAQGTQNHQAVQTKVRQVTGHRPDSPYLVADPAIMLQADGSVWVAGTGDVLRWPSLDALMQGEPAKKLGFRLYQRLGNKTVLLEDQELPWDLQFYEKNGRKLLLGGVMSPRPGREHARWPEDNISRRIKIAEYDQSLSGWVFAEKPYFGTPDHDFFVGHAYGHQLYSENGQDYVFHEEVSYEVNSSTGQPDGDSGHFATELFVRKIGPNGPGEKIKILGVQDLPLENTRRVIGGFLLEGPRVTRYIVQGKPVHVVYFSTGDYPTKNYTVMAAYSTTGPLGPYQAVSEKGRPLNLTQKMQNQIGLYGVGRAFPFTYRNQPWVIFHGARDIPGVDHHQWPKQEPIRHLYVAPLAMGFDAAGKFWLKLEE